MLILLRLHLQGDLKKLMLVRWALVHYRFVLEGLTKEVDLSDSLLKIFLTIFLIDKSDFQNCIKNEEREKQTKLCTH
jgi:hypothetical protein